jgi:hypothetical protein
VVNVPWVNTNTQNTTTLSFVDSSNDIILRNTTGGAGSGDQDMNIVAGSNITLTHTDANNITIASTDTNTFRTVEVDTNGDDSVNETLGAAETLRFKKGTNVTLAESAGVITISSTDTNTTYSEGDGLDLTGTTFSHTDTSSAADLAATARTYVSGLTFDTYGHVTAYTTATETVTDTTRTDEEIRDVAAGQWVDGTNTTVVVDDNANTIKINATDTNTTNWNFKVDTGVATNITAGDTLTFTSGTNVTLAQTGNTIDISSTDTNTQRTNEDIRDVTVAMLTAGTNITLTEDDAANTLTIDATDTNTFRTIKVDTNNDGTANETIGATEELKLIGGTNVTLAESAGTVTITSTDNNTQRTDEEIRDVAAAQWVNGTNTTVVVDDNADTIKINATNTNDVDYINAASFDTSDGVLTLSGVGNAGTTVDLDGRYLTSYSETDTLATVTGRDASTTTDTTFNSHLTMGGTGHYLYAISNAANVSPTNAHGLAFSWNRSGGSRESNIIFAPGSDANSSEEADAQIRFAYKAVNGTISTAAKLWSGGNFNTAGYITVQNGANAITNARVGQWNTAYGWGNHADEGYSTFSGSYVDLTNKPTIPTNYLRDNADDTSSGSLTVVSYKFNGNATNPTDTTATIYDQSGVGLTASAHNFSIRNYNGSSMVESARFTTSSLTVIGDVVAFGTPSDVSFKENIKPIENALDKVKKLQGVTFDWKESDSILNIKQDIGFIAQDVQKVLPELVRENENGKLSLRHQGIVPILLEAIKELSDKVKELENGITK